MKMSLLMAVVAVSATAAGLSGCGGGDAYQAPPAPPPAPPPPAVTAQVPPSASASIAGWISYLQALVVAPADTLEPVDVSAVTPPTDETSSPTPID